MMQFGFEAAATVIGALVLVLLGLLTKQTSGIASAVSQLNGRLYKHVTDANNHEAGLARVGERVKYAESVGKAAHKRIDDLPTPR